MESATIKIGKRGTLVIPAGIRQTYGLEEGARWSFLPVFGKPMVWKKGL